MLLDFNTTKTLVGQIVANPKMFPSLVEPSQAGAFFQSVDQHLAGMNLPSDQLEKLASVYPKRTLENSALLNKLSPAQKEKFQVAQIQASDDDKFVTIYFKPGFKLENEQVLELERLLGREIGMGGVLNNDYINIYTGDPQIIEKAKEYLGEDNIEEVAEPEAEIKASGKEKWFVYDWAGNEIDIPHAQGFDDFEDAWGWIREKHPDEEDWQEYDVRKKSEGAATAAPEAEPAPDWMDEERFMVSKTYDVIDPGGEAIKDGEPEESGFEWEDKKMSANDLLSELNNHFGYFENLDEESDKDQSLYATDPERDYKTGTETMYALHISGAPEDMKKLVPILKQEARPSLGAADAEAGARENEKAVKWLETQQGFGAAPDQVWADGDMLYSYNTVIAKRQGQKLYLNDTKYSPTTSKMQRHLEQAASAAGLKVIPKPQDFFGTHMPRKLTYDEVRRRAASVQTDWHSTAEDIALFCIHDEGLYNALEACKTYNDFERLANQAIEVYNGVTKGFEERHFNGEVRDVVDALMEVKSSDHIPEDEDDELESALADAEPPYDEWLETQKIPGEVVVRHGVYMARHLGEGPLQGKFFHLGHDEAENEQLGKEFMGKPFKFHINENDDAVDLALASVTADTANPEVEKTLEHNQGAPPEMVEKAAAAANEGHYLQRLLGIAQAVGNQHVTQEMQKIVDEREKLQYKPQGEDAKCDKLGRELMISLIDGGWTKEQLKQVAWGLPWDALDEFNLVSLREKGDDAQRSNHSVQAEVVLASEFEFSDQASQEAALHDFLEWMMEGRIENDQNDSDYDPANIGRDVEDQLTGVSGQVNGKPTNDIFKELTAGMAPEKISEIAESIEGIDRIDDGWAYYDGAEYKNKVAQKPAHAATAAADSDMVASYLETALWSSNDNSNEQGGDPLDKNYSPEDIDPDTLAEAQKDCDAFVEKAGALLDGLDMVQVGHDFWLTRNGHGAGFWDGDYEKEIGEKLTQISKEFGEKDLYVGDDGKIHSSVDPEPEQDPVGQRLEDLERKRDQAHDAGDLRKADRYDKMLEKLVEESEEGAA